MERMEWNAETKQCNERQEETLGDKNLQSRTQIPWKPLSNLLEAEEIILRSFLKKRTSQNSFMRQFFQNAS